MPDHGSVGYYEVAAQVIPVLALVLIVEYRLFGGGRQGDWWASAKKLKPGERVGTGAALFVLGVCALLLVAEWAALDAVKEGHASAAQEEIVGWALWLGLFLVFFVPVHPYVEVLLDRTRAYRAKVWLWRRTGVLRPTEPDPPKAGEPLRMKAEHGAAEEPPDG